MDESLASPAPGGASFPLASPAPGWHGTPSTLNPKRGALPGGALLHSLAGFGRGGAHGPHAAGWGFNPDADPEASSTTPSLLLGARGGPSVSGTAPLGAATPAAGTAGVTPGPGGASLHPRLDPADAVDALLRSPNPGGVLEDLLQATSVRRGGAAATRGASPPLLGSVLGSDAPVAGFDTALPELSPRLAAPAAHSGDAELLVAGCELAALAVSAQSVVGADDTIEPSMALAGQPTSSAKLGAGADGSPADTAAHLSSAEKSGSQPERRDWGSLQAPPLLSPAEPKPAEGPGQDPRPGMDPTGSPLAAWTEAWAAGAAGAQGLGAGVEAGEGQGPDPAGFQSLRGSLESSRSLSPRLMLRFEAALAEVSAAPSPAGDPPAGSALGGRLCSGDLAAAQAEAPAPRSPAGDPTELWAGAMTGSASPVGFSDVQSMPWPGEAGSVDEVELQATTGSDTLSSGQGEALGSKPGSPAPQLRRSLEAALAEAGRDSDPNPVAQPDPAPGSPAHAGRSGAGPPLFLPPSPQSRQPGSVGDAFGAERYSPSRKGTLIAAGADQSTDADATPGTAAGMHAAAGGRAVGGAAANLGLAFGSPGSGSPVAAPLSPATVQRHMRTYNSVALADAEDEGLDPGSPGGASGGYPRSDLGQGWRDALFHEDSGSASKRAGGV